MKRIMIIIISLLILTGCGAGGIGGKPAIDRVHTGTKGLELNFLKDSPPSEVYEDEMFLLSARVSNEGAHDIEDAYIILGIEEEYMSVENWMSTRIRIGEFLSNQAVISLEGKSDTNPEGGADVLSIKMQAGKLDSQTEVHTTNIYLAACYAYQTTFSDTICVDTDLYGTRNIEKACSAKDSYGHSSQGGPIAITKIELRMAPSEKEDIVIPELKIHIKNKGNGEVVRSNRYAEFCTGSTISKDDINQVGIRAKLSGEWLTCEPRVLKLGKEGGFVKCRLEPGLTTKMGTYLAAINIELDYGYSFSKSKQIRVRKWI